MRADIILKNANVITMDASRPSAQLVAITGDKITLVDDNDGLDGVSGAKTRVIDCGGRTIVPGFNDAHLHFFSLVSKLLSIDLSPPAVLSIADIKEAVRRKAAITTPGTLLRGTDYNEFYLAEKHCPTRFDLDEAAPDHPVVLRHRSLHAYVLNSLALSLANIDSETSEPHGSRFERDPATGELNGIIIDIPHFLREKVWPPFSGTDFEEGVSLVNRQFLSCGITSFQEASYVNDPSRWQTIKNLKESGKLRSRVNMMTGPDTWRRFRDAGMTTGSGDDNLKLGAVKFLLEIRPDRDALNRAVLECHRAGFQVAFHAIEEKTVAAAIIALEYVDGFLPAAGRRHRIEHCAECPPALLERIKKLGAVIVTQPPNLYYSGERYLATVAPEQLPWLYRIKTPLENGVIVAGSSDTPVVPVNPLMGIYAAVTRRAESGQVLLPEERITPYQALALYTVNAAYGSFEEGTKGSITPGKLADIVVLSDDPARVPPEQIKDIKVEMTIIGGEVVFET
jgi:predicted amidohydrolase YtcJ